MSTQLKDINSLQIQPDFDLAQLICKAVEQIRASESAKRPLMLDDGTRMVRIEMEDILHIEADRVYCHLYVQSHKVEGKVEKHTLSRPLGDVEKVLPAETFVRIHRSHMVNIWKIRQVMGRIVTLDDGTTITMGESYTDVLKGRFMVLNKPFPN